AAAAPPARPQSQAAARLAAPEPPRPKEKESGSKEVPFYRRVLAQGSKGDDPGGFGPNWSNVDDYDIPTVLRKQMD
ncbi:MAG: hypothetical protein KDB94_00750, partial [Acidobacteria bacterium]|nr:hypothetical protein [Acidobacteriota bacterium]